MNFTDNPLLKTIVDSAPIGICILSADDFVAEIVNDKFLEIAGKPRETILGKWYWEAFAEVREFYERALTGVVTSGQAYHADEVSMTLLRHGKPEKIYVTFVYAPVLDDAGRVTKIAVWVLENTAQVREREKIKASNEVIEMERARLYESFSQAPAGISVLSGEEFIFELVNKNYQQFLDGRELLGRPFFEALPELAGTPIEQALRDVYLTGKPVEFHDQLIPIADTENGPTTDRYFTFTYVPRYHADGKIDGIYNFAIEVTHILQSRLEFQQANMDLEQIMNMLPASVVVIRGYDLIVEMINDTNLAYWEKSRAEVLGLPFLEILPDLADQPFAGQLRRVMQTGEIIDVKESPVMFTMPDGSIRETYVDYTYQPLTDVDGNRNGVLVMSFEITERVLSKRLLEKYAEELASANSQLSVSNNLLAKSEARFKFLIQEAPVAIGVLHSRELTVETANQKILQVWGKTEDIIGLPLASALPELEGQPFLGILDNVFTSGEPFYANEIRAMLEHGGALREIFFNVVYQPVEDMNGIVADILIVAVDVTEQVNSRKQVELSEQHFRRLADLVPAKISNAMPGGEVTFFNQQWLDFAGMSFEDLRDFGYHAMLHPDELTTFQTGLGAAAVTGIPYVSEMRFKNREGKYIWHLNVASPILDNEGQITMWVGSTTDIQSLKDEEQRKSDFIGMVSHELKTPLTSLNGYLQLLHRKAEKSGDSYSVYVFEQSLKQVRQMTTMINGFLNVSRLESAKIHIERTTFDIALLLNELEQEHKLLYASHELVFQPASTLLISADREKIAQVINNLVSNAVKYSPSGTRVDVFCERDNEKFRIIVKDQGIGIRQEDILRLFERYYRVENNSNVSGFGIGLYLSAEIIERHGGKIGAESEEGKGSVFFFELPLNAL